MTTKAYIATSKRIVCSGATFRQPEVAFHSCSRCLRLRCTGHVRLRSALRRAQSAPRSYSRVITLSFRVVRTASGHSMMQRTTDCDMRPDVPPTQVDDDVDMPQATVGTCVSESTTHTLPVAPRNCQQRRLCFDMRRQASPASSIM